MKSKRLDAGDLRQIIAIHKLTNIQQDDGSMLETWLVVSPLVYASCDPLSAKEFAVNQTTEHKISHRFTIRYRDGVDPKDRIVYRNKNYNIEGVLPDADSGIEYLTLVCSEETE